MTRRKPDETPDAQAAWWLMRESACAAEGRGLPARERRRMGAWLHADPANQAAYVQARNVIDALDLHDGEPILQVMRQGALSSLERREAALHRRRWRLPALAATAAASLLALVLWRVPLPLRDDVQTYQTSVGERSSVMLADGSEVTLNTGSRVRVSYSEAQRRIDLLEGEALFDVAPNKARPFVVYAGERSITALGTSFNVRMPTRDEPLRVTLLEGHVAIDPTSAAAPAEHRELKPGERLVAVPGAIAAVERVDATRETAWRDGRLIVENVDLAELVRESNRYSKVKLVIGDPQLAKLKVGGVFKVGRPLGIAENLSAYLPVQHRVDGDRVVLLAR